MVDPVGRGNRAGSISAPLAMDENWPGCGVLRMAKILSISASGRGPQACHWDIDIPHAGGGDSLLLSFRPFIGMAQVDHGFHTNARQVLKSCFVRLSAPINMVVQLVEVVYADALVRRGSKGRQAQAE